MSLNKVSKWSLAALVLASAPIAAAWLPLMASATESGSGNSEVSSRSLIDSEGWAILFVLAVPCVVALVPLLVGAGPAAQVVRSATALVFGLIVLVGIASIGMFLLPALVALIGAAIVGRTDAGAVNG